MKYSILVPVYNVEKYLPQCLDSLVNQTYRDFEVILADDGSTDTSGKICDAYAQSYPELFRVFHKENEGILLTRRFSLQQAQGEYVLFVDSDDYVAPQLLEAVDEAFARHNCDMVLFNFLRFTEGNQDFLSPAIPFAGETVFEGKDKQALYRQFVLTNMFVNMWIKAIRRDRIDIEEDYSNKNIAMCEDVIQSLPLFERCQRIVYLDKNLYYYRKNAGSMTLNYKDKVFDDFVISIMQVKKYMELWQFSDQEQQRYYAGRLYFFYELLRNVKITKPEKYIDLLDKMLNSDVAQEVVEKADIAQLPARVQFRVRVFQRNFLKNNLRGIHAVIFWSNIAKGVRSYAGKLRKA